MQEQKIHKVFPEIIKKYTCAHTSLFQSALHVQSGLFLTSSSFNIDINLLKKSRDVLCLLFNFEGHKMSQY